MPRKIRWLSQTQPCLISLAQEPFTKDQVQSFWTHCSWNINFILYFVKRIWYQIFLNGPWKESLRQGIRSFILSNINNLLRKLSQSRVRPMWDVWLSWGHKFTKDDWWPWLLLKQVELSVSVKQSCGILFVKPRKHTLVNKLNGFLWTWSFAC